MRVKHWIIIGLGLLALLGQPVRAEDEVDFMAPFDEDLTGKITKANGECFRCHSEEGVKSPPRAGMDMVKLAKMVVKATDYDHSGHNGLDCRDCHNNGFSAFPHKAEDGAKASSKFCGNCHARTFPVIEAEFNRSIHHEKWPDKFPCETCHDPHIYQSAAKIVEPRKIVAQDNTMCLDCHRSETRFKQYSPDKRPPDLDAIHKWLPNPPMHWKAVRCVDCHTPVGQPQSHEVQGKAKAERRCVECHSADSVLRKRLYLHLARDESSRIDALGFINGIMLTDAYVVGATRNTWVDRASFIILGLVVAGLAAHALARILCRGKKK
ncbi:MAG: cytochrome c3 family protein [Rhodospirillaceae bacterium]|nr:cytochrome c3 family protein [Rhodospirillales bacterium]